MHYILVILWFIAIVLWLVAAFARPAAVDLVALGLAVAGVAFLLPLLTGP